MQPADLGPLAAAYCERPALRHELGLAPGTELRAALLTRTAFHLDFLVAAPDERRWVLRLSPGSPRGLSSSKQIAMEARVLRLVEPWDLGPQVCYVDATLYQLPYGCLVHEYLPGGPLDVHNPAHLRGAAAALARLHSLAVDPASGLFANQRPLTAHLARATALLERGRGTATGDPAISMLLERALANAARHLGAEERFEPRSLTHGDPRPGNWVVATPPRTLPGGMLALVGVPKPRLVDWSWAALDHATVDFCRLLLPAALAPPGQALDAAEQTAFVTAYQRGRPQLDPAAVREQVAVRLPYLILEILCGRVAGPGRGVDDRDAAMLAVAPPAQPLAPDEVAALLRPWV